jgi:hypothetical protein
MSSQTLSGNNDSNFRELLSASARFWEPRRILYNFFLLATCAIWFTASWPHFRPALHLTYLLPLLVLALHANLCYSAAYLIDLPLLGSSIRSSWLSRRRILWIAGTLLALVLANYWIADEIYPDVR